MKKNNALLYAAIAGVGAYYLTTRSGSVPVASTLAPVANVTPEQAAGFWSAVGAQSGLSPVTSLYPTGTVISSTGVPVIPTSAGDTTAVVTTTTGTTTVPVGTTVYNLPPGYILNAKGKIVKAPAKKANADAQTVAAQKAGFYFRTVEP
jgi:hypothetical protein